MEHENSIGESDEWYTPPEIFSALGCSFDLDPCSSGLGNNYVPTGRCFIKEQDGLKQNWGDSFIWMNPPFGGRNGHVPWLEKFIYHNHGIGLCRAYTSAKWFQDLMPKMDCLLFPRGKTKFVKPNGEVGKSPGSGIVLFSLGEKGNMALRNSHLGMFFEVPK